MTAPSTSTTCIRCLRPEATQEDEAVCERHIGEPDPPDGWPDHEGSHLCWRAVAKGECAPDGPSPRVTAGRFVVHDGDFDLLSCSVEEAIEALREAGYVVSDAPSP